MKLGNVLLGITGGIASYKSAYLLRELKKEGFDVKVIMTPFSENFVSPMVFETLSGHKVYTYWDTNPLIHIELARWADVFLIAPCTVNTLSKIANGIGDNLLTTIALAYNKQLLIAPAANTVMYKNPTIQENLRKLRETGAIVIEPDFGILACEEVGEGKLADTHRLKDWIFYSLEKKPLRGKKVLITCGATREYIDPVRFISNDASGEMGFSLARVSRWLGADVKVIAGFTTAKEPVEVDLKRVVGVEDMFKAVIEEFDRADIVIMNSAVSDFVPEKVSNSKIKKKESLTLRLVKGRDILQELGRRKRHQFLVGFALESENLIENAIQKLKKKNLDMIVANPIQAIGSKEYIGYVITNGQSFEVKASNKLESARIILKKVCDNISL